MGLVPHGFSKKAHTEILPVHGKKEGCSNSTQSTTSSVIFQVPKSETMAGRLPAITNIIIEDLLGNMDRVS